MTHDKSAHRWLKLWPQLQSQLLAQRAASPPPYLLMFEPGQSFLLIADRVEPSGFISFRRPFPLPLDRQHWPLGGEKIDLIAGYALSETGGLTDFLAEASRVLIPGGSLVIREKIVPGSDRRGRQARRQQAAGAYLNALTRFRDPGHAGYQSLEHWSGLLLDNGFRLVEQEIKPAALDLRGWLAGQTLNAVDAIRLEVLLRQAPAEVADFLQIAQPTDPVPGPLSIRWPEVTITAVRHA